MEKPEKKEASMTKSIVSVIVLLGLLMLLTYAAPMLTEKLRERSTKETSEEVEQDESEEEKAQPQVSYELAAWLPLVTGQLPKLADGSAKYKLQHMRLNEDKSQLLLDLREGAEGESFDLILKQDQFGRYISENSEIPVKIYPPER